MLLLKLFCIWNEIEGILGFILNMRAQVDNVAIDFIPSIGVTQDSILLAIKSLYSSTCILILCKNIYISIPILSELYHHQQDIFLFFFIKKEEQEEREKNLLLLHLCCI